MIKRRANLSIEHGGSVFRRGKGDKRLKLGSFCRLFQTQPILHKTMLCVGFGYYPACPDLARCRIIQATKKCRAKVTVEVIPEHLTSE